MTKRISCRCFTWDMSRNSNHRVIGTVRVSTILFKSFYLVSIFTFSGEYTGWLAWAVSQLKCRHGVAVRGEYKRRC